MAHHAPAQNAIHRTPLFSPPATSHAAPIPRWTELDAELRQALIGLLTRMIGDSLPGSPARVGKGDADEPG
jgi:hypothetical protein